MHREDIICWEMSHGALLNLPFESCGKPQRESALMAKERRIADGLDSVRFLNQGGTAGFIRSLTGWNRLAFFIFKQEEKLSWQKKRNL